MENKIEKVKNIVAKTKDRIVYLHNEGLKVETENKVSVSFEFGKNIKKNLILPYTLENENLKDNCNPLYLFFNQTFRVWTEKDNKTILGMGDSISFIFNGYELIGMNFDIFTQLDLFHLDYVEEKSYGPPMGDGVNFRYYDIYYNIEYQMTVYVWRKRIREITLRDTFFLQKKYEDSQYLDHYHIKKITD